MSKMEELEKRRRETGIRPTREEVGAALRADLGDVVDRQARDRVRLAVFDRLEALTVILRDPARRFVVFEYTNHAGKQDTRTVSAVTAGVHLQPADARWYPGAWVLRAYCMDRSEVREFSLEAMTNPRAATR